MTRIRLLDAARSLYALFRDPDDTAQVFAIIDALSGDNPQRVLRKFRKTPPGERLLRERRSLVPVLADRESLRNLPEGSLGRAYLAFCERAGITAEGLVTADQKGELYAQLSPDEQFVHDRLRDTHDLWHVAAGYQTDLIGEACVLALTVSQTRNPGVGLIVLTAFLDAFGEPALTRKLLVQAVRRGLGAAFLPCADWEALLSRPLDEVRRELGLGEPPSYRAVWPHEVYPNKAPPRMHEARA